MLPLSWRELLGSKVSDFILWLVFSASFSSIWKEAKENGFQFYATKTQNRWKKTIGNFSATPLVICNL